MLKTTSCLVVALLALLCSVACDEPADYKVLEAGAPTECSAAEIAAGVRSGRFSDTSLVFVGREWVTFREYPPTAELLAARSATASPDAIPASSPAPGVPAVAPVLTVNASNPGATMDLAPHLVAGRTVIVDFYSEYCPPCVAIAPYLEKLATVRPEYVIRKIDINRPGVRGIDWGSPVARQFDLHSIPHFKIYDAQGRLTAEGDQASQIIQNLLSKI